MYKCYCPNLNKFMTSVDVTFFKSKSYFEFESSLLEFGDDELSL